MAKNIIFSQEQKELIALLPDGLPKMTDGAKLVLSDIILLYGTDFAKENGYVFRSFNDMMRDTGLGSRTTITTALRKLELLELVTIETGNFEDGLANNYYLSEEMKQKIHFKPMCTVGTVIGTHIGTHNQNTATEQQSVQLELILKKLNELSEENRQLREHLQRLEKKVMCTTDSYTDSCTTNNGTIPTGTGTYLNKKEQEEKSTGVVSSSLQIIEEENHPDTNASSTVEPNQADRLTSSQLDTKTQPQPLDKGKYIQETLDDINQYIISWLSELTDYKVTVTDDYVDEKVLTPLLSAHKDYFSCNDDSRYMPTYEIRADAKEKMNNALRNNYWRNKIFMNTNVVSESATTYRDAS